MSPLWWTFGAVGGVLFILVGRRFPDGGLRLSSWGLLVAAAVYVVFALIGRAPYSALALEASGVVGYGTAALMGMRGSRLWCGFGWLTHALWDGVLHAGGTPWAAYTPATWVALCLAFDLVVAGRWLAPRTSRGGRAAGTVVAAVLLAAPSVAGGPEQGIEGTWRLLEWTAVGEDGSSERPYGEAPQGRLSYSTDKTMALQLYRADRPAFSGGDPRRGTLVWERLD